MFHTAYNWKMLFCIFRVLFIGPEGVRIYTVHLRDSISIVASNQSQLVFQFHESSFFQKISSSSNWPPTTFPYSRVFAEASIHDSIREEDRLLCLVWDVESWNPFFFVGGNTKRDRFLKVDSQELVANNVESHKDRHRGGVAGFQK